MNIYILSIKIIIIQQHCIGRTVKHIKLRHRCWPWGYNISSPDFLSVRQKGLMDGSKTLYPLTTCCVEYDKFCVTCLGTVTLSLRFSLSSLWESGALRTFFTGFPLSKDPALHCTTHLLRVIENMSIFL